MANKKKPGSCATTPGSKSVKETQEAVLRTQTTIRLPSELMERLKAEAERCGKSIHGLIVNILWKFVRAYPGE